jgi:hypothetical protein
MGWSGLAIEMRGLKAKTVLTTSCYGAIKCFREAAGGWCKTCPDTENIAESI